jgi:hypothetical protein
LVALRLPVFVLSFPRLLTLASYFPKKRGHLINVGQPIWALDFLPQPPSPYVLQHQILAVAGHPRFGFIPELYKLESGPNVIQLWAVAAQNPKDEGNTYLATLICHNWGTCWGLKFCPHGAYGNGRAGILAGVFGDGIVRVFDIRSELIGKPGETVNVVFSEPAWEYSLENDSFATCIAWKSHFEILVGYSNGTITFEKSHDRICCRIRSQRHHR